MFIVTAAHRCFCVFSIMPIFFFSACISGGGGGGGGGANFGNAASEYAAQSGLGYVAASAALDAGYSGRDIRIGIADSGIDGQHSEFVGRVHAGHDWHSNEIRDYLTAGAAGYLTYSISAKALLAGLRMINVGEVYVPAEILAQEEQVTRTGRHWLTGRERDVLNGLLSGQSNKEIARAHGLSEVTIKHHLKSLRSKLGARNRTHAVCRAIELGIAEDAGSVMSYSTA